MSKHLRVRTQSTRHRVGKDIVNILDKSLLVDDTAVDSATRSIDVHLGNHAIDVQDVVHESEAIPHLLEFLLSGKPVSIPLW